ncbi:integrin alpha-X-like [Sceloporus undulatus]|uniref:integrin alpha-X-like n=1 Tax=Sceloporus undulatus TaxID=8520 RepID=UPI001C4BF485|nr:integrin alpha-X-like [Sceloporus undulatus]
MGHAVETRWTLTVAFLLCIGSCFLPSSRAQNFNVIDTKAPVIFKGDKANHFGYRVVPVRSSGASWLLVSAPLSNNRTGSLFRCSYDTERCQQVDLNHPSGISLGLSLATDEVNNSRIIACGPTWERRCGEIDYLNGICYVMGNDDQNLKEIHPAFQECVSGVDAVILYDDSGSIYDADFKIMQNFFLNLMKSVQKKDVQFAAVQFSTEPHTVFDFAKYNTSEGQIENDIRSFQRIKGNTFTPTAIRFVVNKVFIPQRGMRPHSKKVLIVLTDGQSNDNTNTFAIAKEDADKKGIIRYAIGVGKEFLRNQDELRNIASSAKNVFYVKGFNALSSLQKELQNKIFGIEGTFENSSSSSFQQEFSQGGFSTLFTAEHVVSGTVGSYEWSGGLEVEFLGNPPQTSFLNGSDSGFEFSYLGYSMALAHRGQRTFYVVGAPRYQHIGKVVLFEKQSRTLMESIRGKQIGSYYGAELSAVDLNGNGDTDLILIGAPFYYNGTQGGLVEVCSLSNMGQLSHLQTLRGIPDNGLGKFGAALSSLGDVNGDGLADVVIGAPMEDEDHGAIYIFLGEVDRLRDVHSQRISASSFSTMLHFFGQSIQGKLDLSGDELTDLAVGALGTAVILRSRPVFTVISSLSFSPSPISLDHPNCGSGKDLGVGLHGNLSLCFTLKPISTKWSSGTLRATIKFTLQSDAARSGGAQSLPRLMFENERSSISEIIRVGMMTMCVKKTLQALGCLDDTFSPFALQANFSAEGQPDVSARNLRPILDPETNLSAVVEVPFKQDCGPDDICVSDLRVSFNFSGSKGLKLSPNFILNLTVKLENVGETAYEPGLSFYYSPILSFRGASVLQSNWRLSPACKMHGSQRNASTHHSSCSFRPPALKRGTQAFLQFSFRSSKGESWHDKFVSITIQAHSQNENDTQTLSDNKATGYLPVLHPVDVIVKGLESTTYLNFSTENPEKKILTHAYEVTNMGSNSTPVNVTFELPLKSELGFFWNVTPTHSDVTNQFPCIPLLTLRMGIKAKNFKESTRRGCLGAAICTKFQCLISSLSEKQQVKFNFSGEFYRQDNTSKLDSQSFHLRSEASVVVDETRFFQNHPEFHFSQIITEVELISPFNRVPIIIGSTIGGILLLAILVAVLYKFGFFKRKRIPQVDETALTPVAPSEEAPPPSSSS